MSRMALGPFAVWCRAHGGTVAAADQCEKRKTGAEHLLGNLVASLVDDKSVSNLGEHHRSLERTS